MQLMDEGPRASAHIIRALRDKREGMGRMVAWLFGSEFERVRARLTMLLALAFNGSPKPWSFSNPSNPIGVDSGNATQGAGSCCVADTPIPYTVVSLGPRFSLITHLAHGEVQLISYSHFLLVVCLCFS